MDGTFDGDLVGCMSMSDLCEELKGIMERHIYSHIEIAHREQTARSVIAGLLSTIIDELYSRPKGPLACSMYRPAHIHEGESRNLGDNYQVALRATDYVSGMTDGHALSQYQRISGMLPTF
jgi:dGTP triphosphohydrolase